ncbi:MAG: TAXI family TRAP transporter solute-binding subunit [Chloroflexota bacterium]
MSRNMGIWLAVILIMGIISGLAGCGQATPATTSTSPQTFPTIRFASREDGSTGYICAVAMADVFRKSLSTNVNVQALPSSAEDFLALKEGRGDIFITGSAEFNDAYNGTKSMAKAGRVDVRALGSGGIGGAGIIVTNASGVTSGPQLKSKKLYINYTKMQFLVDKGRAVLKAYGLDPDKDVTLLSWSTPEEVTDGMREGKGIGVYYLVGGAKCEQLDATIPGKCRLLPLPQDQTVLEKYMLSIDPSCTLGTVQPQATVPEPTPGWIMCYTLGCRPGISDDLAYALTKAMWENVDQLAAGYRVLGTWKVSTAIDPFLVPFHPGAIKYYKEKGVWTVDRDKRQAELLGKFK